METNKQLYMNPVVGETPPAASKKKTAKKKPVPAEAPLEETVVAPELVRSMRRFRLKRTDDESGVSGVGYVAEGTQFSDGTCVIKWLTETSSIGIYHSHADMIHIHGHGGKTVIEWIDEKPSGNNGNGHS